ncbi:MAG TPA: hypothetical protein VEI81_08365, partial [Methanoregula sp.]|nr:hypothetical protein [Methanoregula sp.]
IIYLRSRQKKEYHKMVQSKDGHFKFERPTPPKVGFFLWLESIQPTLGTRITLELLDNFSIAGPQRDRHEPDKKPEQKKPVHRS